MQQSLCVIRSKGARKGPPLTNQRVLGRMGGRATLIAWTMLSEPIGGDNNKYLARNEFARLEQIRIESKSNKGRRIFL